LKSEVHAASVRFRENVAVVTTPQIHRIPTNESEFSRVLDSEGGRETKAQWPPMAQGPQSGQNQDHSSGERQ
jgi:hypothetical protein